MECSCAVLPSDKNKPRCTGCISRSAEYLGALRPPPWNGMCHAGIFHISRRHMYLVLYQIRCGRARSCTPHVEFNCAFSFLAFKRPVANHRSSSARGYNLCATSLTVSTVNVSTKAFFQLKYGSGERRNGLRLLISAESGDRCSLLTL